MSLWNYGPFDSDEAIDHLLALAEYADARLDDETAAVVPGSANTARVAQRVRQVLLGSGRADQRYAFAGLVAAALTDGLKPLVSSEPGIGARMVSGMTRRGPQIDFEDPIGLGEGLDFICLLTSEQAQDLRTVALLATYRLQRQCLVEDFALPLTFLAQALS